MALRKGLPRKGARKLNIEISGARNKNMLKHRLGLGGLLLVLCISCLQSSLYSPSGPVGQPALQAGSCNRPTDNAFEVYWCWHRSAASLGLAGCLLVMAVRGGRWRLADASP